MSFSRLSPRSSRTGIVAGRAAKQKPEESSRHLRLWEAIRRTGEEIDNWQRQVDQVDGLFKQFIVPREEKLTDEYCNVTGLLIAHFEHAGLAVADQSLLGLWITENLQALSDHPFAPIQRRQALSAAWRVIISVDGPIENQLSRLARNSSMSTPSHDDIITTPDTNASAGNAYDANQAISDDQLSDNEQTASMEEGVSQSDKNDYVSLSSRSPDEVNSADNNNDNKADVSAGSNEEKINILEQRLSIDRLFRQLAKVLHPDRETDESLKAEKHILMSQCLKARQEKDINTLLSLYCEHVGDLPDELTDNSHEELICALQQQLKQLQIELRQLRFGDPLHTQIVERYSAANDSDCENRIKGHADSLDLEIENTQILATQLDSQLGLQDALEQRREVELDRLAIDELTGMSS